MKVFRTILAILLVCMPILSLARPPSSGSSLNKSISRSQATQKSEQSKPVDFTAKGKVALGVPLLKRRSGELKLDYESGALYDNKQDRSTGIYRIELGYMVVRNVQLRLGLGYFTYDQSAVDNEEFQYIENSLEYGTIGTEFGAGARYYFDLENGFYPFVGTQYTFLSFEDEYRGNVTEEEESTVFDLGAGVLFALGGETGGFLSLLLSRQMIEEEETSSEEDPNPKIKSTAINLELTAGLYF